MVKKTIVLILILSAVCAPGYGAIFTSEAEKDPQKQAAEIHKRASSDPIFTEDELKALYYQNLQIIALLKDIRELLQKQLEKE